MEISRLRLSPRSRMSSNSAMHAYLRLAHSLLMFAYCDIGARLVGRHEELSGNHHVLDGPLYEYLSELRDVDRRTREVARKGILVEERSAMVVGDHVEVLRQATVSDETRPLLYANHMPRAIEVRDSKLGSNPLASPGFQERIWSLSVGRRLC